MAKRKDQKKKERERRVAQKKLAAAAQRREQEKTAKEAESAFPKTKKGYSVQTQPKPNNVPTNKPSPFAHRRTGGG